MEYKRVSYAFYTSSPQFLPFFPSPPPLEFVPISNEILETIEIFLVPFFLPVLGFNVSTICTASNFFFRMLRTDVIFIITSVSVFSPRKIPLCLVERRGARLIPAVERYHTKLLWAFVIIAERVLGDHLLEIQVPQNRAVMKNDTKCHLIPELTSKCTKTH